MSAQTSIQDHDVFPKTSVRIPNITVEKAITTK